MPTAVTYQDEIELAEAIRTLTTHAIQVGAVETDGGLFKVAVGGSPITVDVEIREALHCDLDGVVDTARGVLNEYQALAGLVLDNEAACGLLRLLTRAVQLREQAIAGGSPSG
jgi:hypothetical protein